MKKIKLFILLFFLIVIGLFLYAEKSKSKTENIYTQRESVSFIANSSEGWSILSQYIKPLNEDSVHFELIIKHSKSQKRSNEQLLGIITESNFHPKTEYQITYHLLHDNLWRIRLDRNGHCYLKHISGKSLREAPFIFPFQIRYKVN